MSKKYSQVEIEKGLIAAATLGIRPAARELGIPQATLHQWTQEQSARYAELREQEAPKWRARASAEFEDVVERLTQLEQQAMNELERSIERLEPKEVSGALKNISVAKGVNTQHVHNLRGQPSQIVEHRYDMAQVERAMQAALNPGEPAIDVEAVEVPTTTEASP